MTDTLELVRRITELERTVDGLIKPEVGRWVDWTPTVDQGGAVAITINHARYEAKDDAVIMQVHLSVTGAGTAGNAILVQGIPAAIAPVNLGANGSPVGAGYILDSGTAFYNVVAVATAATAIAFLGYNIGSYMGATPSFALAAGDIITFIAVYER